MLKKKPSQSHVELIRKIVDLISQHPNYSFSEPFCQIKAELDAFWIRPLTLLESKKRAVDLDHIISATIKPSEPQNQQRFDDLDFPLLPLIQLQALIKLKERQIDIFPKLSAIDQAKLKLKFDLLSMSNFLRTIHLMIHQSKAEHERSKKHRYNSIKDKY